MVDSPAKAVQEVKQSHQRGSYSHNKRVFKIIVLGDSNVGKTCLTYRFCESKYLSQPESTIGLDFREKTVIVDDEEIKLWDTAGQERFRKSMVAHYYRNVHAVVFVYDVTKFSSFQALSHWIEECNRHNLTRDIPRILVGNKSDCSETQAVLTSVAQKFADFHNMPLFETSAKEESEHGNINGIFLTLAHKLKNQKPMMMGSVPSEHLLRADVISVTRECSHPANDGSSYCYC
ncbi:putative Ras-related protein Rab-33 isoform X2 [Ischnura elegans]|uniref:putative Ras-related protein Rab-33 isoform X2 n=1 Tax=Ischnura elegans TaxID=197161 RepID=UPI001ED8A984|nr:putative Ras-related protein Rab-33 isoform X2 [Ischnura elegans]